MVRPRSEQPTPAELEVLKILWDRGPSTVRDVMEVLENEKQRAYTSVMSLLNVMAEKGLLSRERAGRAFLYQAAIPRRKTLGEMVGDLWLRAFSGSTSSLVAHLLEQAQPTEEELRLIREAIEEYQEEEPDPAVTNQEGSDELE